MPDIMRLDVRMAKLHLRELPRGDALSRVSHFLKRPTWNPSLVIPTGAHSVRYEYQSEIRFGPALYRATVVGPAGSAISRQLETCPVFAPRSAYHPELDWYAFVEWRGDVSGQGSSAIRIVDLARGEVLSTRKTGFAHFVGWRGSDFRKYVFQEYDSSRLSHWLTCDANTGKKRVLFRGGHEGHISADGKHLLVLHTRKEVFAALVAIDSASVLDKKQAADFENYVQKATGLDTVSFDALAPRLISMLNWTSTDYQTGDVIFEKLITIEVTNE
jgi:hypothetical protein